MMVGVKQQLLGIVYSKDLFVKKKINWILNAPVDANAVICHT